MTEDDPPVPGGFSWAAISRVHIEQMLVRLLLLEDRVEQLEAQVAPEDPVRAGFLRFRDRCRARERGDS